MSENVDGRVSHVSCESSFDCSLLSGGSSSHAHAPTLGQLQLVLRMLQRIGILSKQVDTSMLAWMLFSYFNAPASLSVSDGSQKKVYMEGSFSGESAQWMSSEAMASSASLHQDLDIEHLDFSEFGI